MTRAVLPGVLLLFVGAAVAMGAEPPKADTSRGDRMLADYFRAETERLRDACLADIRTSDDWKNHRDAYRSQLLDMLGLDPLPPKTDLKAVVTGKVEQEAFVVEKVHFQSRPGLYVTGNLYLPKQVTEPLPAILYVCGHGGVKKDGISYGNKVHYQHHGAWFASNGYVCLTIDSLQLGEIESIHHGTYRYGMWWWLNRGYTPAGVEAWNCIRALDYLETRPEVDSKRLGVTGRSGGGVYSWWIAAIDERVQAAVPVAGITDLENHVVDGCVEGHCDCMFLVNTYRWDYPLVAALVAPRPLLISNTDTDRIFPLDGVVRTFEHVRRIYGLCGAADKCALNITSGPHKDTQELRVHAFRWLNHHLKKDDALISTTATKFFEPEQLRVFDDLPEDELNTEIHETFVPLAAEPRVPEDAAEWERMCAAWTQGLLKKTFAGWPAETEPLQIEPAFEAVAQGIRLEALDFTSQGPVRLRLFVLGRDDRAGVDRVELQVMDDWAWRKLLAALRPAFEPVLDDEVLPIANESSWQQMKKSLLAREGVVAYVAPRGVGPTAWDATEKKQVQHRRRFYLLGQTLEGMQVWDVRRAVQAVRSLDDVAPDTPIELASQNAMAGVTLYAALFEPDIARLILRELPLTHRDGPYLLNVRRIFDIPQTVALVATRVPVTLEKADASQWDYPRQVSNKLEWNESQFQIAPAQ